MYYQYLIDDYLEYLILYLMVDNNLFDEYK